MHWLARFVPTADKKAPNMDFYGERFIKSNESKTTQFTRSPLAAKTTNCYHTKKYLQKRNQIQSATCYNKKRKKEGALRTMKLLFFDMEFANGKIAGSIYSLGYLVTDEAFHILIPPTDMLINPQAPWNEYVEKHILAYPKEQVENAPDFTDCYGTLCRLFEDADIAVGFAVGNDLRALRAACKRYSLPLFPCRCFDTERLCKEMREHTEAHGLGGYVQAWCGEEPENRHRSDGDAYATMMLLRAICNFKHVTPQMLVQVFPDCIHDMTQAPKRKRRGKHTKSRKKPTRTDTANANTASARSVSSPIST